MKNKKFFAILTLVAFMLTMMPVMAFATAIGGGSDVDLYIDGTSSVKVNKTVDVVADIDGDLSAGSVIIWGTRNGSYASDVKFTTESTAGVKVCGTYIVLSGVDAANDITFKATTDKTGDVTFTGKYVDVVYTDGTDNLTTANVKDIVSGNKVDGTIISGLNTSDNKATFKNANNDDFITVSTVKAYESSSKTATTVTASGDKKDNYDGSLDANNVAYYKVTAKVTESDANGSKVTGKEVTISTNKTGVTVSKDSAKTDSKGTVEFNVMATKSGSYKVTLSTNDTNDDTVVYFVFGANGIDSIKVAAQPTGAVATGETLTVPVIAVDANGNELSDLVAGDLKDYVIKFTKVPADSDIDEDDEFTAAMNWGKDVPEDEAGFFTKASTGDLKAKFNVSEEGSYTAKIVNNKSGKTAYVNFEAKEFGKAVTATVAYDSASYSLGAKVDAPTLKIFDANGTNKEVTQAKDSKVTLAYTGTGVDSFTEDGTIVLKDDDKYLGKEVTVSFNYDDKCYATTSFKIADEANYLAAEEMTVPAGTDAKVVVKSLDLNNEQAAIGSVYSVDSITSVVTSKPEGATVTVDDSFGSNSDFVTKGASTLKIASNKEGTVAVNLVVKLKKTVNDKTSYKYLTGTATVNFGKASVNGANSTATLIMGSTTFVVNGAVKTSDVAPVIVAGRTYLPVRAVAEALGATVEYADGVVTVKSAEGVTATMTIDSKVMTVGTETVEMDAAPYIVDGRTMVPVRYAAQAIGYSLDTTTNADGTTATVTLVK